jgi:hypothetical protein
MIFTAPVARAQDGAVDPGEDVVVAGDWTFTLGAAYRNGDIDGYIQTAAGGEPGTTSLYRPTLSDVGIDDVASPVITGDARWRRERFTFEARLVPLSGNSTLDETLVSEGRTFPAGTAVDADIELDWYRLMYGHTFPTWRGFTLTPSVGAAMLSVEYDLAGAGGVASRTYHKTGAIFGLEATWPAAKPWWLELELLAAPPFIDGAPRIAAEALTVQYRLLDRSQLDVSISAGLAFEQLWYDDKYKQEVANDVHVDIGPAFIIGIDMRF